MMPLTIHEAVTPCPHPPQTPQLHQVRKGKWVASRVIRQGRTGIIYPRHSGNLCRGPRAHALTQAAARTSNRAPGRTDTEHTLPVRLNVSHV